MRRTNIHRKKISFDKQNLRDKIEIFNKRTAAKAVSGTIKLNGPFVINTGSITKIFNDISSSYKSVH